MSRFRTETIGDAKLTLGDCRAVLPTAPRISIVTDPPYGINFKYNSHTDAPDEYSALLRPLTDYPRAILQYPEEMMRFLVPMWGAPDDVYAWCYESNLPRQFRLWGFWDVKPNWSAARQPAKWAHLAKVKSDTRDSHDWCSDVPQVKNTTSEKTDHPCQIPVALVERIIAFVGEPSILDPFMGSGTTGVACANLGLPFVGIEKDEGYFDIACRRIEEAYRQPRLFDEPVPRPVQETLL